MKSMLLFSNFWGEMLRGVPLCVSLLFHAKDIDRTVFSVWPDTEFTVGTKCIAMLMVFIKEKCSDQRVNQSIWKKNLCKQYVEGVNGKYFYSFWFVYVCDIHSMPFQMDSSYSIWHDKSETVWLGIDSFYSS